MSITETWEVQRTLGKAQAIPIVGPLIVSPVKAVVSIAQLVAGVALGIIFGTPAILSGNEWLGEKAVKSLGHAGMGLLGLMYSAANILSLGLVGYKFEKIWNI